jgi:hypothetical protein
VKSSVPGEIGDAERHAVAYGLSFVEGGNHDYGIFSYTPPANGDWFRALDFNGYDHNMTTGLGLKNYDMKRDIFNDKSDLLIYLEDAVEKITCYDLRDTLLNGYNLRCFITASGGSGKYYVVTIPVDKQSLSFRVPFWHLLQIWVLVLIM